jgi:hypothetical protein
MIPDRTDADDQSDKDAVFVEQYRLTGDAVQACIRAGIRDARYPITVVANRQLQKPEIVAALKALERIATSMQPLEVTRDSVVADMQDVYEKALQDGQYASAIGAKKLQSMLLGMLQTNISITHGFKPELMTDEQLMRIASAKDISKDVIEVEDE